MRRLFSKLRWMTERRRREADRRAELDLHRERMREDAAARGMAEGEARGAARQHLGNRGFVEDAARAAWGWTWFDRLSQDLLHAGRLLRRRPVLSAAAIITLTLGIGGTTAAFSLLDALVMRTLPVENPGELVRLVERRPDGTAAEVFTLITHDTLQRASNALSWVIASSVQVGRPAEIEVGGQRRSAFVQLVSENYFDVLGIHAFRGRLLRPEPGAPGEPIAVISEEYWRRQYGGDLSVLGARFRRGTNEFTIGGIAPPGFRGTEVDIPVDIWISIDQVVPPNARDRTEGRWMRVMGRLRPGVTRMHAGTETIAVLGRPVQLQPGATGRATEVPDRLMFEELAARQVSRPSDDMGNSTSPEIHPSG